MNRVINLINVLYTAFCFFLTKIFYNKQKIIRFPFQVKGVSFIEFGRGLSTGRYCRIEAYSKENKKVLIFGDNCQINDNVHIVAKESVILKDNVLIASRVFISDLNHGCYSGMLHSDPESIVSERELVSRPVVIGNNVWIGEGAVILPGVIIGDNSIIGANSVVTRNIEANSIYAGNPARLIKKYCVDKKQWISINNKYSTLDDM